jgi:amidophosphoribosyltransferase
MSMNGNLVNTVYLREFLDVEARRHVNTDSDTELLYVFLDPVTRELSRYDADSLA